MWLDLKSHWDIPSISSQARQSLFLSSLSISLKLFVYMRYRCILSFLLQIFCNCSVGGNTHERTMTLFEMLGCYKWDAKAVLVLSAFATTYGEFWLIMQLYPSNPLAASVALLKQLPHGSSLYKPRLKSLSTLVETIIDVTKCIIKFEGLPRQHIVVENDAIMDAKSLIYITTYWVIRSSLACSSQITDLIALKNMQMHVPSLQSAHS